LIQIQGPPSLRQKLRALCEEFSDIFDTAVWAEPANIHVIRLIPNHLNNDVVIDSSLSPIKITPLILSSS
jgi:hypothetical protein